ncbi:hypothetical protein AVEN_125891-1, partial [Araneus ventricosus]
RFEGKKLLEVGSGATVHSIASASAYFPIIVQSDFVEDNLENLKLWHKGQSPLDWSAFLDIVASLEDFKSHRRYIHFNGRQRSISQSASCGKFAVGAGYRAYGVTSIFTQTENNRAYMGCCREMSFCLASSDNSRARDSLCGEMGRSA